MTPVRGRRYRAAAIAALIAAALTACAGNGGPSAAPGDTVADGFPLRVVRDVPLPGDPSRLDYQDVDPTGRRLYIAHLGDGTVHVVDLDDLRVVATVDDIASAHGVRVASDIHRLYASATGTDELVTIDTATNRIVRRAPTGRFPDGIAYDPEDAKVYVSDKDDHVEAVIDAHTGERIGTIDIGGRAGNTAYDPTSGSILVNVEDRGRIAVIDPADDTVSHTIDTPGCDTNHGLYIDPGSRLAFVACEGNAKLLTIDLDSGTTISTIDIGREPDVLAFDDGLGRLYVASESGTVTVLDADGRNLRKVAEATVSETAHTVAVDPATHRVFFPLDNVGGHPVLRVMAPTPGG